MKTIEKRNYQKEEQLQSFAYSKFKEYSLMNWNFLILDNRQIKLFDGFNRRSVCGCCNLTQQIIFLPRSYVVEFKLHTLKDIILHEVAHAIYGYMGHTPEFRRIAKSIGCKSYKAQINLYVLNMYGKFNITPQQKIACMENYLKRFTKT
jgi:predicted SprT family Zn-dependent metalloprotease